MSDNVPPIIPPPPAAEPVPAPQPVPLDKLPYPPFVLLLAIVTMVTFVAALVRVPKAFSEGVAFEKAEKEIAGGKFDEAAEHLKGVVLDYPRSKKARLDLIEATAKGSHPEEALDSLGWFEGRRVTEKESQRLDELAGIVEKRLKENGQ